MLLKKGRKSLAATNVGLDCLQPALLGHQDTVNDALWLAEMSAGDICHRTLFLAMRIALAEIRFD